MGYKRVCWSNGDILGAEHLEKNNELIGEWICSLRDNMQYGLKKCKINEAALSTGLLSIDILECIFPDSTYINYSSADENTQITFDCNKIDLSVPTKFYLGVNKESDITQYTIENEKLIQLQISNPKIYITNKLIVGIPFMELYMRGRIYNKTDFVGPWLQLKNDNLIYTAIEKTYIMIKNWLFNLRDHNTEAIPFVFIILGKLDFILNNTLHPFKIYELLNDSIAAIAWMNLPSFPRLPVYDHNNMGTSINNLLSVIYDIVSGVKSDYISLESTLRETYFEIYLAEFGTEDILINIEPNETDIRTWIMTTPICSQSVSDNVWQKRILGVDREIVNSGQSTLVVKIKPNQFLKAGENLLIYHGGLVCLNRLTISIKKS